LCDLDWQRAEIERFGKAKRGIFAQPRCGKTRAAAKSLAKIWKYAGFKRGIIAAPKRVCAMWADIMAELDFAPVLAGQKMPAKAIARELACGFQGIIVLSEDVLRLRVTKSYTLLDRLVQWQPDAYIRDESHNDGDPGSARSKCSQKLSRVSRWYRALTGTPAPNHYGNLWPQLHAVDPATWHPTYSAFRSEFLIADTTYPTKIIGHVNVDKLQAMILKAATTVTREEIFGKDSWIENRCLVDLPKDAQCVYDRMVKEWLLTREQDGADVRGDHTLTRMLRLQEIASGYLSDAATGTRVDLHTAKVDAVLEDLTQIVAQGEKAVVYHRFTWEAETYMSRITAELGKKARIYAINGSTSDREANAIWREKFLVPGPAIIIVQVRSGGTGISLASAQHALFVSLGFGFATEWEQPRDRIFTPGRASTVTQYLARGTVDEYIAATLAAKKSVHDSVMHVSIMELAYGRIKRPRLGAA
jgi:hypothetical protein